MEKLTTDIVRQLYREEMTWKQLAGREPARISSLPPSDLPTMSEWVVSSFHSFRLRDANNQLVPATAGNARYAHQQRDFKTLGSMDAVRGSAHLLENLPAHGG